MKHFMQLIIGLWLTTVLLTVASCKGRTEAWEQMDLAETLMEEQPDSSLTILNSLKTESLGGEEERARYALLKSMALDKNYIDTTTFDVLQAALDYYPKHGTPDEILKTRYYQGTIFLNKGDNGSAMTAFMRALENRENVSDSLALARVLVAKSSLLFKQFKTQDYVNANLDAASLFEHSGEPIKAIKAYCHALGGIVILDNRQLADSIKNICYTLISQYPEGRRYSLAPFLSYSIEYESPASTKALLDSLYTDVPKHLFIEIAKGYSKVGLPDKAKSFLVKAEESVHGEDSLRFHLICSEVYEANHNYRESLDHLKLYTRKFEDSQHSLLSENLLFASEKYEMEISKLKTLQKRDRIIWVTIICILGLALVLGWLIYRHRLVYAKRVIVEKENESLKLEQEILKEKHENAELELEKKALEAENLLKEKERLESERHNQELEAAYLKLSISKLEEEKDRLTEALNKHSSLAEPVQRILQERIDALNSLIAKEIANNEKYAEPYTKWIEAVKKDKDEFMNSTRIAISVAHPKFMDYLKKHDLTQVEINYLCLYIIGLRGKEVGEYMQLKRHYNISSDIRRKLGIDEHETNIGPYIRRKILDF